MAPVVSMGADMHMEAGHPDDDLSICVRHSCDAYGTKRNAGSEQSFHGNSPPLYIPKNEEMTGEVPPPEKCLFYLWSNTSGHYL
jgi:hypothetical protein